MTRVGSTAYHPAFDFDGRAEGRLNIANYNVDSGAPVVSMVQFHRWSQERRRYVPERVGPYFLGIHHEGITTQTHLGLNAPDDDDEPVTEMHLAKYIKATELLDIEDWVALL